MTPYNLGPVRDTPMNPYIFVNNIRRRIQNSVDTFSKIQISNGQKFKFLTVKNSKSVNAGEKSSNQFMNVPKVPGPHFKPFLSYRRSIIWCGTPCPAVYPRDIYTTYILKPYIQDISSGYICNTYTQDILLRHIGLCSPRHIRKTYPQDI